MRFLITTCLALAASTSWAAEPKKAEQPPEVNCDAGPLHKNYGGTAWLVYACNDLRSVVLVSDKGNPAAPFCFILYVNADGDLQLYGEGTGKKSATQAAYDELQTLTPTDVAGLIDQAQAVQASADAK